MENGDKMENNLWKKILATIQKKVNPHIFDIWFTPIKGIYLNERTLNIEVPNKFYKQWLSEHCLQMLYQVAEELTGKDIDIQFTIIPSSSAHSSSSVHTKQQVKQNTIKKPTDNILLNPKYSFDNFVIGSGNRFAHAAALAVAESPARAYNPLFFYGRVGLGKTHLLQAIAHYQLNHQHNHNLIYISSERFTNQFINAIRNNTLVKFRQKYRYVDVLLIDDIQFIANKESTQEEFFHTFNVLYDAHKQIILSSDRPPKEISGLEERLISRFNWGLVADIQPPDLETRIAILKKRLEKEVVNISDEVILFIAQRIKNNIRELEGALIRVIAHSSLGHQKINLSTVEHTLRDSIKEEKKNITPHIIQEIVANYFGLNISELKSKKRSKNVVYPRQIAIFLTHKLTNHSLKEIGSCFNGKDHTTILHSCKKIENGIKEDTNIKLLIDNLIKEIKR